MQGEQMTEENQIEKLIQMHIQQSEKKMEVKQQKPQQQKQPVCARCHKPKKTRKHHWPLGSLRLVPLCNHCYSTVKKQRSRSSKHWGGRL